MFVQDHWSETALVWLSVLTELSTLFRAARSSLPQECFRSRDSPILSIRAGARKHVYEEGRDWGVDLGWDFGCHSKAAASTQQLFPHPSPPLHAQGSIWAGNAGLVNPNGDGWIVEGFFPCCFAGCRKPGIWGQTCQLSFWHPMIPPSFESQVLSAWRGIVFPHSASNGGAAACTWVNFTQWSFVDDQSEGVATIIRCPRAQQQQSSVRTSSECRLAAPAAGTCCPTVTVRASKDISPS